MSRPLYLAHPYGGERKNLLRAKRWLLWSLRRWEDAHIWAPWIPECEVLGDSERERGMRHDLWCVAQSGAVILVGGEITAGMSQEAQHASLYGLPIHDLTDFGEEPPWVPNASQELRLRRIG